MDIVEAWKLWLQGHLQEDVLLWGISILWWGRIGKVFQFFGGITIIAEIIGIERLRAFGKSIHGAITFSSIKTSLRNAIFWYKLFLRLIKTNSKDKKALTNELKAYFAEYLNWSVSLAIAALITYWLTQLIRTLLSKLTPPVDVDFIYDLFKRQSMYGLYLIVCMLVMFTIAPIITLFRVVILNFIGFMFDWILIEPLAFVLQRKSLATGIKVLALLFLLLGFHFNLLAS